MLEANSQGKESERCYSTDVVSQKGSNPFIIPNEQEAVRWFEMAAKIGDSRVQLQLGNIAYQNKDIKKSLHWYLQAGYRRNPDALKKVGEIFFREFNNVDLAVYFFACEVIRYAYF